MHQSHIKAGSMLENVNTRSHIILTLTNKKVSFTLLLQMWKQRHKKVNDFSTRQQQSQDKRSSVKVLVVQWCPTLRTPMDCSPSGSSVHGILQARILQWVALLFSRGSSKPRNWTWVFCIAGWFFTVWATSKAHRMETAAKYFDVTETPRKVTSL